MDQSLRDRIDYKLKNEPHFDDDTDWHAAMERMRAHLATMPAPNYPDGIPDREMLEAVAALAPPGVHAWATVWDLADAFGRPQDEVQAKAHDLIHRNKLDGCDCGCRGDYSIDNAGLYERQPIEDILARGLRYDEMPLRPIEVDAITVGGVNLTEANIAGVPFRVSG